MTKPWEIMSATSAMGIIETFIEMRAEAIEKGDYVEAEKLAGQIAELQEGLDQGRFFPEGAGDEEIDGNPEPDGSACDDCWLDAALPTPKGWEFLLRAITHPKKAEQVLGDFREQYLLDANRHGERAARWLYAIGVVRSVGPIVWARGKQLVIFWLIAR